MQLLKPGTIAVTLRQSFVNVAGQQAAAAEGTKDVAVVAEGEKEDGESSSSPSGGVDGGEEKGRGGSVGDVVQEVPGCWELLEASERRMSWGPSMMFVYRRTDALPPAPTC